jgi:hypothetical protein
LALDLARMLHGLACQRVPGSRTVESTLRLRGLLAKATIDEADNRNHEKQPNCRISPVACSTLGTHLAEASFPSVGTRTTQTPVVTRSTLAVRQRCVRSVVALANLAINVAPEHGTRPHPSKTVLSRNALIQTVTPNRECLRGQAPARQDCWRNIDVASHARRWTLETLLPRLELDAHRGVLFALQTFVVVLLLEAKNEAEASVVRARLTHALHLVGRRNLIDWTWAATGLVLFDDFVSRTIITRNPKRRLLPNRTRQTSCATWTIRFFTRAAALARPMAIVYDVWLLALGALYPKCRK